MSFTLATATETVIDVAEEFAKALGLLDYVDGQQQGYAVSIGGYYPVNAEVHDRRKMILNPRSLSITGRDWTMDVMVDSTYEKWFIYSSGDHREITEKLTPLFLQTEGIWPQLYNSWTERLRNKQSWAGLSTQTPTNQPRQQDEKSPVSFIPGHSRETPMFGNVSSGLKPTTRMAKEPHERWSKSSTT